MHLVVSKKFLEDLLENPDVVKFTELTKLMEDEMSKNEKVMNMSTKKNLRRKIENYTSKIEFRNIDSALYIIPETLSFDMLLEKFISVRNDVEYLRQLQKDDVAVINAAEIMRSEMKSSSSNLMSWPPTSDELSFENINIEHYTDLFFNKLSLNLYNTME